jgi:hypothetical protein
MDGELRGGSGEKIKKGPRSNPGGPTRKIKKKGKRMCLLKLQKMSKLKIPS